MKIALLGNMNNNFFALCRYLHDLNLECDLLLFDNEFEHFSPSADSYNDDYQKYTKNLKWGSIGSFSTSTCLKEKISSDLRPYDFLIGCGTSPAFTALIDRPLDLFLPYGSDLMQLPFFPLYYLKHPLKSIVFRHHHRQGLRNIKSIMFDPTDNQFENIMHKLSIKANRIISTIPMVYTPQYTYKNLLEYAQTSELIQQTKVLKEQTDFLMIHSSRHCWKKCQEPESIKNNNYLFFAMRKLLDTINNQIKVKLITFEYGVDVEASKNLIRDLNLEEHIVWFPITKRKDIMGIIQECDLVVGEFNISWLTYGVVIEAMSMRKPVLHHCDIQFYQKFYPEIYPMLSAKIPDEIYQKLLFAITNQDELISIGQSSKDWFDQYIVKSPLDHIVKLLEKNV